MTCSSLQRSPFVGNSCAYSSTPVSCAPPVLPPPYCPPPCPPLVGPTGPTGATGPSSLLAGPAFVLSASLNSPTVPLTNGATTVIPFNLVFASNLASAAQFDTSTGAFTILVPGQYRIDYGVQFSVIFGVLAGNNLVLAVRQNLIQLSNATYTFSSNVGAASVLTLGSFFSGSFDIGDKITISAVWTSAVASSCSLVGPAVSNTFPYNTTFTVRSLF